MNVVDLLRNKKINEREYQAYLLFQVNDSGREFLKNIIEGTYMEEPVDLSSEPSFAWIDGRRSVWRDIKNAINKVQHLLLNS